MPDDRTEISKTPVSVQGRSLQSGYLTVGRGLASALAEIDRAPDQAKVLNNMQMHRKRGIWTAASIGILKHRATVFNAGARFLDFAIFYAADGTPTFIQQVGSKLQSYVLATTTETDIKTGLSATALPCMRNFGTSTGSVPILVYCNGDIEPRKVITATTEAALNFNGSALVPTEIATVSHSSSIVVGGTITATDVMTMQFASLQLAGSPVTLTYAVVGGDTTTTIATALKNAVNASAALKQLGISATSSTVNVSIVAPVNYTITLTTSVNTGATETLTMSTTSLITFTGTVTTGDTITVSVIDPLLPTGGATISYKTIGGDTTSTIATAIVALINAAALKSAVGYAATAITNQVVIVSPMGHNASYFASVRTTGPWPGTFLNLSYSKPALCEPFGDRMVYGRFAGTASFQVLISDLGSAENFTEDLGDANAVAFTFPAILGPLRGLRSFKVQNEANDEVIIGGCSNGFFLITGNSQSTFSMKILTRAYGLLSNRAWIQRDNDLLFPTTDGIRTFLTLQQNTNLAARSLTNLVKDIYNAIDFTRGEQIHAVHVPRTQEIQFWFPVAVDGDGRCRNALILNYNNDQTDPTVTVPVWSTKNGIEVAASINFFDAIYGGDYAGFLHTHYSTDTYNGVPIQFSLVPSLMGLGPGQTHSGYKVEVVCDGQGQKFGVRPYFYERVPDTGAIRRSPGEPMSRTLTSPVAGSTALGAWTLGTSAFPEDHVKTLSFDFSGNGIFSEVEIFSSTADSSLDFSRLFYIISGGGINR